MTDRQSAPEPLPAEPDLIPEEELVPEDDAIIGRAFRWSAVVIVLIVAFVGLAVLWANRTEPVVEVVIEKDPGAIENLQPTIETLPDVSFKDITVEAGIDFVHTNGARGDKLLPETMGSGAAFFDYDGDGDQDLLLINSTHWPGVEYTGPLPTMALYRNDGQGAFSNVTIGSGLEVTAYGMGVAVGDYD
ncbi:MAG: FG-GAP repeat domain-containing protein, partial [Phycisphaerales bacterium]